MFFFFKLDFKGGKLRITQFHMQFTHVSKQFWALRYEEKKNSLGTVLTMWSQICGKIALLVYKVTSKKSKKVKTHKT